MSIEYLGLSKIDGPLIVLEGVMDASFEEIVELKANGTESKLGRIIELDEDKALIQVFEDTHNMSLSQYPYKADGPPYGNGSV